MRRCHLPIKWSAACISPNMGISSGRRTHPSMRGWLMSSCLAPQPVDARDCVRPNYGHRVRFGFVSHLEGVARRIPAPECVRTFFPVKRTTIARHGGEAGYFRFECDRIPGSKSMKFTFVPFAFMKSSLIRLVITISVLAVGPNLGTTMPSFLTINSAKCGLPEGRTGFSGDRQPIGILGWSSSNTVPVMFMPNLGIVVKVRVNATVKPEIIDLLADRESTIKTAA